MEQVQLFDLTQEDEGEQVDDDQQEEMMENDNVDENEQWSFFFLVCFLLY